MSGYPEWDQREHASDWMLLPDNLGVNLRIDETSLQDGLFTFLSNKDGHCRQGTIIAAVRSKTLDKESARPKLQEWYKAVKACSSREVKAAREAIKSREDNVLNYFINRSTNAAAESLNSKLKSFRAQLRGVSDLPFFMFRLSKIFG